MMSWSRSSSGCGWHSTVCVNTSSADQLETNFKWLSLSIWLISLKTLLFFVGSHLWNSWISSLLKIIRTWTMITKRMIMQVKITKWFFKKRLGLRNKQITHLQQERGGYTALFSLACYRTLDCVIPQICFKRISLINSTNYLGGRTSIAERYVTVVMALLSIKRKTFILWKQVKGKLWVLWNMKSSVITFGKRERALNLETLYWPHLFLLTSHLIPNVSFSFSSWYRMHVSVPIALLQVSDTNQVSTDSIEFW